MFLSCENTLSEIFFLKLLLFLASLTQNTTVIKVYIHDGLALSRSQNYPDRGGW